MDWRLFSVTFVREASSMTKLSAPLILLIDSDPVSLATTRTALDSNLYKVFSAQDTGSAMLIAAQRPLDLVISDIRVENESGISIIKEIRKLPGRSEVPVMFSSASQAPGVIRRVHEFGAAFHLRKPVDPTVLLDLVERSLWMPHLVHNHIEQLKKPHMPLLPKLNMPIINSPMSTN